MLSNFKILDAKNKKIKVVINKTTPRALAAPQLNWSSRMAVICIETIITFPPPRTAGVT